MKMPRALRVNTSLLMVSCCLVQELASAAAVDLAGESVEQIEIVGDATSDLLRAEIRQLEQEMFDLFNELNSTDDFDIKCRFITHTMTRLPTWGCEPRYLTVAHAENAEIYLATGFVKTEEEVKFENRVKTEQLYAEFTKLAQERPELAKAIRELNAKKTSLVEQEED